MKIHNKISYLYQNLKTLTTLMKRIFLLMAGILAAGVMAFAQSIDGTWVLTRNLDDDPEMAGQAEAVVSVTMTLGGGRFTEALHMETKLTEAALKQMTGGQEGAVFEITADASFGGASSREGDILTLTPDKKKPQVDIKTNIKGIPMGDTIANAMKPSVQKNMEDEMDDTIRYQIISVTATELTLSDVLSDKEKKRGEKAETFVFKRK